MQQASQITEPDYAPSWTTCSLRRERHPFDRFIAPRVEVELAFVLNSRCRSRRDDFDCLEPRLRDPPLEIIDSRIEQFDRDTRAPRKSSTRSRISRQPDLIGGLPVKPDAWTSVGAALLYKTR